MMPQLTTTDSGMESPNTCLLYTSLGLVQRLLEHLGQGFAVLQLAAGLSVQIRAGGRADPGFPRDAGRPAAG